MSYSVATLILPQLWAMSIGPLLNVDQFTKFITVIKALSTRVETEHFQRLSELKRLEESSGGQRSGGGDGVGGMTSGLGMVNPGVAGVSDFEALVRGTTNSNANGLGARGRQVDIFSDESPVCSSSLSCPSREEADLDPCLQLVQALTPTPTGGNSYLSSPPLPALPTSSPPFMSPSSFPSSSTHTIQPTRPSPAPRLSSTSSSSAALARSSLGARSVPSTSFNSSIFPAPSPSQTPPPAPPAQNGNPLRSFAPLQPQSRTSPATHSYPTTPSASSSSSSQQQPNYNFSSLSLSSTSSGGLPPLAPTSSSIFPSNQPPAAPQPIQWNVVPPLQPTSSPQQQRPNLPPGYSSNSGTLQPTVRNQGGGAGGGKTGWGNWEDLDPLK